MESSIKNNKYKTKCNDELEIKFLEYLKNKYQDKNVDLTKINIISERNEFIKKII